MFVYIGTIFALILAYEYIGEPSLIWIFPNSTVLHLIIACFIYMYVIK